MKTSFLTTNKKKKYFNILESTLKDFNIDEEDLSEIINNIHDVHKINVKTKNKILDLDNKYILGLKNGIKNKLLENEIALILNIKKQLEDDINIKNNFLIFSKERKTQEGILKKDLTMYKNQSFLYFYEMGLVTVHCIRKKDSESFLEYSLKNDENNNLKHIPLNVLKKIVDEKVYTNIISNLSKKKWWNN